ncbi:MAG TPA: hypothetical protein VFA26_08065 [Gemmataceae bacterium]|nr:hypothetical protein [Gemmataceae bacterium]
MDSFGAEEACGIVKLPRGITGFWAVGEQAPPASDTRAFRGHCHEVARRLGGGVLSVEEPSHRNFTVGTVATAAGSVAVLLNARYPFIGFAEPPRKGEVFLQFRDSSALAEVLREFGVYEVLPASELERRPTPDDLGALSEAELELVAYWRPQRVGDLIFNYWD